MGNQLAPLSSQQPDYNNLTELGAALLFVERLGGGRFMKALRVASADGEPLVVKVYVKREVLEHKHLCLVPLCLDLWLISSDQLSATRPHMRRTGSATFLAAAVLRCQNLCLSQHIPSTAHTEASRRHQVPKVFGHVLMLLVVAALRDCWIPVADWSHQPCPASTDLVREPYASPCMSNGLGVSHELCGSTSCTQKPDRLKAHQLRAKVSGAEMPNHARKCQITRKADQLRAKHCNKTAAALVANMFLSNTHRSKRSAGCCYPLPPLMDHPDFVPQCPPTFPFYRLFLLPASLRPKASYRTPSFTPLLQPHSLNRPLFPCPPPSPCSLQGATLAAYADLLCEVRSRLSSHAAPNVLPFRWFKETPNAAYLARQFLHSNLLQRMSTPPFLTRCAPERVCLHRSQRSPQRSSQRSPQRSSQRSSHSSSHRSSQRSSQRLSQQYAQHLSQLAPPRLHVV
eukprot:3874368-Pleurochrysis_carterae.AAC.2